MIATVTHYISVFNTNCVEPSIDWIKNHKTVVSVISISVLLGAACFKSPQTLDMMKKNIKFLTVIVPIAYTIPAPIIGFCIAITEAGAGSISYDSGKLFEAYRNSIVKVWQAWFRFVGIPS